MGESSRIDHPCARRSWATVAIFMAQPKPSARHDWGTVFAVEKKVPPANEVPGWRQVGAMAAHRHAAVRRVSFHLL